MSYNSFEHPMAGFELVDLPPGTFVHIDACDVAWAMKLFGPQEQGTRCIGVVGNPTPSACFVTLRALLIGSGPYSAVHSATTVHTTGSDGVRRGPTGSDGRRTTGSFRRRRPVVYTDWHKSVVSLIIAWHANLILPLHTRCDNDRADP